MEFSKKQERKLYNLFVDHVTKLTSLVLDGEDFDSLSDDFVEKVGEDCAEMIGEFSRVLMESKGKMTENKCQEAESILAEGALNISSYVESFTPEPLTMREISSICLRYMMKTDIKRQKWSMKR
jgi:hypothetical protein